MAITILAVGRMKDGPERALLDGYLRRCRPPVALREVEEKRRLPPDELRAREAALIRAALPPGALIVALDERGTALASRDFAARLAAWQETGRELAFVIGGSGGLDAPLRDAADFVLSFGPATWPYLLVRIMLAEQIYRAQAIRAGHPYHRG